MNDINNRGNNGRVMANDIQKATKDNNHHTNKSLKKQSPTSITPPQRPAPPKPATPLPPSPKEQEK
ncbi:hypothetical protein [Oscillibacter sp.]|uniref:hypothetical protein n=1 Tax=Oscillibacter sp. TaxID=1945593 RepID=UPI00339463B5